MNVPKIDIGRYIRTSPQDLWELLTDTTRWALWGPSITAVDCSERYIQLGSTGRVRTAVGLWVPFAVTEMEDGRYWSWHVFGMPATGHRIDQLSNGLCRLVFQVPVFAAPYIIVCRIAMHRIARILQNS
jgi:hypothetical protein